MSQLFLREEKITVRTYQATYVRVVILGVNLSYAYLHCSENWHVVN